MVCFNVILFLKNYVFYYAWFLFVVYEHFPYFCIQLYIWKDLRYILSNISKFLVAHTESGYLVLPIIFLLQEFLLVSYFLCLYLFSHFIFLVHALKSSGPLIWVNKEKNHEPMENITFDSTWISNALFKNKIQRFHHSLHH